MNPSTKLGFILYVMAVTNLGMVITTIVLTGRMGRLARIVSNLQDRAIVEDMAKLEQLGQ